jgi:hypothetical protein
MKPPTTLLLILMSASFAAAEAPPAASPPVVPPGFDACPAAMRTAVLKAAGSDRIEKLRIVRRGERTLYLVDIDRGEHDLKLQVLASGEVVRRTDALPLAALPPAVAKTLGTLAGPSGIIDEIKMITEGGATHFKAEIDRMGQPELDVKVAPDGKVLEQKSDPA